MGEIIIANYPGRIFYISYPARLTDTPSPLPARNIAVMVYPDAGWDPVDSKLVSTRWGGWYPQVKPGIDGPWDGVRWGQLPNPIPEHFNPYPSIMLGEKKDAFPLSKNELFPVIKKTRALYGCVFYAFALVLIEEKTTDEKIIYKKGMTYQLFGDFPGFEDKPVIDL
jgi:hypothetical protein